MNQGEINYDEITTEDFRVYFDRRNPEDGIIAIESLENAKPVMEKWLGIARPTNDPLKVVMSSVTNNASFANFILDAIELQTPYQNVRDLAWHEYSHAMMYQHYQNFLGGPGTMIHIIWMPAWFLEGLAEVLSVSVEPYYQSGVERWQALRGNWPSYDRLHSLYQNYKWSARGYSTSGSFVSWMLRKLHRESAGKYGIHHILADFRTETNPWNLFTNWFFPMDDVLEKYFGKSGEQLYEEYRSEAKKQWQIQSPYPFLTEEGPKLLWTYHVPMKATEKNLYVLEPHEEKLVRKQVNFDQGTGWLIGTTITDETYEAKQTRFDVIRTHEFSVNLRSEESDAGMPKHGMYVNYSTHPSAPTKGRATFKESNEKLIYAGRAIRRLYDYENYVAWFESNQRSQSFCFISKKKLKIFWSQNRKITPNCPLSGKGRVQLEPLGASHIHRGSHSPKTKGPVWLRVTRSGRYSDEHAVVYWNPSTTRFSRLKNWNPVVKPLAFGKTGQKFMVLAADRNKTHVMEVSSTGECKSVIPFSDFVTDMWALGGDSLVLKLYQGFQYSLKRIKLDDFSARPCWTPLNQSTPLLEGIQKHKKGGDIDSLGNVLTSISPWKIDEAVPTNSKSLDTPKIGKITNYVPIKKMANIAANLPNGSSPNARTALDGRPEKAVFLTAPPSASSVISSAEFANTKQKRRRVASENNTANTSFTVGSESQKEISKNREQESALSPSKKYSKSDISPSQFRWESPVLFPWIGGEDPAGFQLGFISVPLVDDLQNHLVNATILVGIQSRFPSTNIKYSNRRYKLPLDFTVFRRQTYNGSVFLADKYYVNYWDEVGAQIESAVSFKTGPFNHSFSFGIKYSDYKPYLGYPFFRNFGEKTEPFIGLASGTSLGERTYLSMGLSHSEVSATFNDNFDYNRSSLSLGLAVRMFKLSKLSTGIEYAQTRGPKQMFLREFYSPLKTHIPGSGGGVNQANFDIAGDGSLFSSRFGDTKARSKINFTVPLVHDLNTFIWLFYFERLDFSAFVNYGGAWWDAAGQTIDDAKLIGAHGYNLDLLFENKGVGLNFGLGTGQVFDRPFAVYAKFGFDALF